MSKSRITFILSFIFLSLGTGVFSPGVFAEGMTSEEKFHAAIEGIAKLELEKAYEMLENIESSFPKTEEAKKAKILKSAISATLYSTYKSLVFDLAYFDSRYQAKKKEKFDGLRKETIEKEKLWKDRFIASLNNLIYLDEKDMEIKIMKNFTDVQLLEGAKKTKEKLMDGIVPSAKDIEALKKHKNEKVLCVYIGYFLDRDSAFSSEKQTIEWMREWNEKKNFEGKFDFVKGLSCLAGTIDLELETDAEAIRVVKRASLKITEILFGEQGNSYFKDALVRMKDAEVALEKLRK